MSSRERGRLADIANRCVQEDEAADGE